MFIHIVVLAWLYVVVMMAVAEAMSPQGSVLGALFTFMLYGALPIGLIVYVLATPARKRARKAQEAQEEQAARAAGARLLQKAGQASAETGVGTAPASNAPDQRGEAATGGPIPTEREKT